MVHHRPRIRTIFAHSKKGETSSGNDGDVPAAAPVTINTTTGGKCPSTSTAAAPPPLLDCAFHITDAFSEADLVRLEALRQSLPLDRSRPTCPRRFVTEKDYTNECCDNHHNIQQHQTQQWQDGWIGALVDRAVASWNLFGDSADISDNNRAPPASAQLQSLPWYRFLEYSCSSTTTSTATSSSSSAGDGDDDGAQEPPLVHHSMDRHTDGSNVHPATGARSVATMLLYLSTCRAGGETTLYYPTTTAAKKKKKRNSSKKNPKSTNVSKFSSSTEVNEEDPTSSNIESDDRGDEHDDPAGAILERIRPVYNTVLIFPHFWPHSGDPVLGGDEADSASPPKIALRVDLAWKPQP